MKLSKNKTFDVLIEIPKGSRNKYEYDFVLNKNLSIPSTITILITVLKVQRNNA